MDFCGHTDTIGWCHIVLSDWPFAKNVDEL